MESGHCPALATSTQVLWLACAIARSGGQERWGISPRSSLLTGYRVWGTDERLSQRCEVKRLTMGRRSVAWEEVELPEHCSPFL